MEEFLPEEEHYLDFPEMAETKVYQLHRFNGQNYQLWKRQMEIYMTENKLKPYILGTVMKPATNSQAWEEKDAEAQAFIMRGLELQQLKYLTDCTTAAQMWSRLKTIHAEKSEQSAQVLLEKFINLKMEEDDNVMNFIATITSLTQRLKDMNLEQKEQMIISKILCSLPSKYDHVRTAWYAVPRSDQNIDKLTDHLVNEERLLNLRSAEISDNKINKTAFTASKEQRNGKFKGQSGKKGGKCNYCHKPGHWARECFKRQRDQQNKGTNQHNSLSLTMEDDWNRNKTEHIERAQLFVAHSNSTEQKYYNIFYADSGATDHMSFQRQLFKVFKEFSKGDCHVKVGDGRRLCVRGVGDIEVKVPNSRVVHTIKSVLLVPELDRNLISVCKCAEKGMKIVFEEGAEKVSFMKGDKIIVDGTRNDKLYKLNFFPVVNTEHYAANSISVWHERLGHVNYKTLQEMNNKKPILDMHIENIPADVPFCEGCAYGKQHRESFPKQGANRAKVPGEVFHADLCGKMSVPSIGKSNYFLLLKDDFSRYCFVYFLKNKTEVLDKLMEFCAEVQACGFKIKRLRTDGGSEFCNEEVNQFLLKMCIKHDVTTPRAPEQNGFIERQNRTVVESAKAMIHQRGLPLHLWAEATNTAVYVKNRTPSVVLNGKTPYELWWNKKPSVGHLKIFGSDAFVHVPKEQRTKWERNAFKGLMVGYNDESKAYRIYDPTNRNILIRRDVKINETKEKENEVVEIREIKDNQNKEGNHKEMNSVSPIKRSPYNTRSGAKSKTENSVSGDSELCIAELEPTSLEEVLNSVDCHKWLEAIEEEITALNKNETWTLVERTKEMNVLSNQWVFKRKYTSNGEIEKYKARLVVRGCFQKAGVDYNEVYSPVVRYESVRVILSIAAAENMSILQFDVKTAFLHGIIEENIFMEQPFGFEKDDRVCRLKKSLYGLKQASHQWNKRIVQFLVKFGFKQSTADLCVFIYAMNADMVYLALYVDDGLICGNSKPVIEKLLRDLHTEFEITYKEAEFFVGIQIDIDETNKKIKIFQNIYIQKILQRFNHINCSTVSTPAEPGTQFVQSMESNPTNFPYREAIGSLMYLMVCTRPDLAYIVGVLSRYVENPSDQHWKGVKRVFKYLKGTDNLGITFNIGSGSKKVTMYCDSDFAGDLDTRRSTTGWIAFINDGPVAWSSKKQTVTATSTTEAEFIALCAAAKEVKWLRKLTADINASQTGPTPIQCDNQRAITLVHSPQSMKRTRHIDVRYFYTCDLQRNGDIDVQYVESGKQLADVLTKPLCKYKFNYFINEFNMSKKEKL